MDNRFFPMIFLKTALLIIYLIGFASPVYGLDIINAYEVSGSPQCNGDITVRIVHHQDAQCYTIDNVSYNVAAGTVFINVWASQIPGYPFCPQAVITDSIDINIGTLPEGNYNIQVLINQVPNYSAFQAFYVSCDVNCIEPGSMNLAQPCSGNEPVCGCDGVTYDNWCEAFYYHGVTEWTQGACPPNPCDDNPPVASISGDVDLCFGDQTMLSAVSGGAPNFSYAWSNGESSMEIALGPLSSGGTYIVTVTDDNGCMDTVNVVVDVTPQMSISNIQSFNLSGSFIVSGGLPAQNGSNYSIIDMTLQGNPGIQATLNTAPFTDGETVSFLAPQAGSYSVNVIDAIGCSASATVVVTTSGGGGGYDGCWEYQNISPSPDPAQCLGGIQMFTNSGAVQTIALGGSGGTVPNIGSPGYLLGVPQGTGLKVTEIFHGQAGVDLTADWFEISNSGSTPWVSGVDPELYYDDVSAEPADAVQIMGINEISAGGIAIVLITDNPADISTFLNVWSPVVNLSGIEIGYVDGAGLGSGGDAVTLWIGDPSFNMPENIASFPDGINYDGHSFDVVNAQYSTVGGTPGTGFATGGKIIVKTTDWGENWSELTLPSLPVNYFLTHLYFLSDQVGWVVGENNTIIKTTDGGQSWIDQSLGGSGTLRRPYFSDTQSGWMMDYMSNSLLQTNDGGDTWTPASVGGQTSIEDYFFLNATDGFVFTTNNGLYKTTNGGAFWSQVNSDYPGSHNPFFINEEIGWVSSFFGVHKTIDGGLSWTQQFTNNSSYTGWDIRFTNEQMGFMIASIVDINKYDVYRTSDGGENWIRQNLDTTQLIGIWHDTPNEAWVVGCNNIIAHYSLDEVPECINTLEVPFHGSIDVDPGTVLQWTGVQEDCLDGYLLYAGTSPGSSGLLNGIRVTTDTMYQPAQAFPPGDTVYVRIVPYNGAGEAAGCDEYWFVTEGGNLCQTISCNDNIDIDLGPDCMVDVTPEMVLENFDDCTENNFEVEIFTGGIWAPATINADHVNSSLDYRVYNVDFDNYCWGTLSVEDSENPEIFCQDLYVPCLLDDYSPATLSIAYGVVQAVPPIDDNCLSVSLNFDDEIINFTCYGSYGNEDSLKSVVIRTWTVTDDSGNSATCEQVIYIEPITLDSISFPGDTIIDCSLPDFSPDNTGMPVFHSLDTTFNNVGTCIVGLTYSDDSIPLVGPPVKILRLWRALDWCSGDSLSYLQIISLGDSSPPEISCPDDLTVTLPAGTCSADIDLPDLIVLDSCSAIDTIRAEFPINGVDQILLADLQDFAGNDSLLFDTMGVFPVFLGVPAGMTTVRYSAVDLSGNSNSCEFVLNIFDTIPPVVVCESGIILDVSPDGFAFFDGPTIDNGSFDDCCSDLEYSMRRLQPLGECDPNDGILGEYLEFCCDDLGDTIQAVLRVSDCSGNFNECIFSVIPFDDTGTSCLPDSNTVIFSVGNDSIAISDTSCLEVSTANFDSIVSVQFGLSYNPSVLDLINIDLDNNPINLLQSNFSSPTPGELTFSWLTNNVVEGTTVPDNTILFSICFEAISGGGFESPVVFGSMSTPITSEVTTVSNNNIPLLMEDGFVFVYQPNISSDLSSIVDVNCNGNNTGSIDIDIQGGIPPYTFNWQNQLGTTYDTEDLSGLAAGTYWVTITDEMGSTITAGPYIVSEPAAMLINEAINPVSCFSDTNGAIDIAPSGGTPPYSYAWSSGPTTEDLPAVSAGIYSVTITDANNCVESFGPFTVDEPSAALDVSIDANSIPCAGMSDGELSVIASGGWGGFSYNWAGCACSGVNASGLSAGSYSVTVTDQEGCTSESSINLGSLLPPPVSAGNDTTLCEGSLLVLQASGTGDFQWQGGPASANWYQAATQTQLYTVVLTDLNGCTAEDSVLITVTPNLSSLSFSAVNSTCFGENNASIELQFNGGSAPFSYDWNDNQYDGIPNPTGLAPGTYSVTVIDAFNCTTSNSVSVTEPAEFQAVSTDNICIGGNAFYRLEVVLSGGTGPYQELSGLGQFTGNIYSGPLENTGDSYQYEITDANGCGPILLSGSYTCDCLTEAGTMDPAPITVCGPGTAIATFNNDSIIATGSILQFVLHQGSGNVIQNAIAWNNQPIFDFQAGMDFGVTYYISAVAGYNDGNNSIDLDDPCLSISIGTPVVFNEALTVTMSETICAGESIVVGGETFDVTGNYTIPLQSGAGCDSTILLSLLVQEPEVALGIDVNICNGDTIELEAVTNNCPLCQYNWSGGMGSTAEIEISPEESTMISVVVVDSLGCMAFDSVSVFVGTPYGPEDFMVSICEGGTYELAGQTFSNPGFFPIVLETAAGCDSTLHLYLEFMEPVELVPAIDSIYLVGGSAADPIVFNALENDSIPTGIAPGTNLIQEPAHGIAEFLNPNELKFTLVDTNFVGLDSLVYAICDPNCIGYCEESVVYIHVRDQVILDNIEFSNTITPNGDGFNDWFDPLAEVLDQTINPNTASLTIINRWGEKIFHSDPYQPWDGHAGGQQPVPEGAYFYILRLAPDKQLVQGYVNLILSTE